MAEEHRECEPTKIKKSSKGHEGEIETSKVAEISSSGTSDGKSESPSSVTHSDEKCPTLGITSVSKKSDSASSAVLKAPVPSKEEAVPKETSPRKKGAVAKETSPRKKGSVPKEVSPKKKGSVPKEVSPKKKGAVPKETSPRKKGAVPKETSPKKKGSSPKATVSSIIGGFVKWASPPKKKTVKGSGSSAESDESPDKKEKPAKVSGRKKITATIKDVGNILFGGQRSKSCESDEVDLINPEAESRHEKDIPCQTVQETELGSEQTDPDTPWEPKYVEITDQENYRLRGLLTASYETLHPIKTDSSSFSGSISLEVERASSLPLDHMDSREGSTGDASSLEREFEGLSSPSKSIQGLKRFQHPIEEEEEDATEFRDSPRKCRLISRDTDPTEKPSDIEIDPTEKSSDSEINPMEKLSDTEIDPTEKSSDSEINPMEKPSDTEIDPTEKSSDTEIDPIERPSDIEMDSTEKSSDTEIYNMEKPSDTEIDSTEKSSDTEIDPMEKPSDIEMD